MNGYDVSPGVTWSNGSFEVNTQAIDAADIVVLQRNFPQYRDAYQLVFVTARSFGKPIQPGAPMCDSWGVSRLSVNARYVQWATIGLIVIGLVLFGMWSARVIWTVGSLMTHVNEAQALLDGNPLDADLTELSDLVYGVRADVATLKCKVGWATKLGPALCWVPKVWLLLA